MKRVQLSEFAKDIIDKFVLPYEERRYSIFLCGADLNSPTSLRKRIADAISYNPKYAQADLLYPEDLFERFLYDRKSGDLLSLELLLAKSVDIVVVVPESPGSFAELGAFSANQQLASKIVCVGNSQYKRDSSFINLGPIKQLRKIEGAQVLWCSDPPEYTRLHKIAATIYSTARRNSKSGRVNLLNLKNCLLPLLYVFSPMTSHLANLVLSRIFESKEYIEIALDVSFSKLIDDRLAKQTSKGEFELTQRGVTQFVESVRGTKKKSASQFLSELDKYRLKALNWSLGGKLLTQP